MRERVELANGTFMVRSTPGRGTTIVATLPLDAAPAGRRLRRQRRVLIGVGRTRARHGPGRTRGTGSPVGPVGPVGPVLVRGPVGPVPVGPVGPVGSVGSGDGVGLGADGAGVSGPIVWPSNDGELERLDGQALASRPS